MPHDEIFLHSCVVKTFDGENVIIRISEIDHDTNAITPKLKIIKNPKRSFYVTKPKFRTHKFKKEVAPLTELDRYDCYNYELPQKLSEVLGVYSKRNDIRALCKSPYVYGADIKIEALIKMRFLNKYGLNRLKLRTGFLDIETSIENKNIILISYTHENKVYTAIAKQYMFETDANGNRVPFDLNEVMRVAKIEYKKYINQYGFTFELFESTNEMDLIKWIMARIFENKTDFIGIWNMNFDIPYIINRIKAHGLNPKDIFVHPEVPNDCRTFYYRQDNSKVSHMTLKWHWLTAPGYSQFIDSMGLFSQCRRTSKFRTSYTLDSVLKDYIDTGKKTLGDEGSHYVMQTQRFKEYILYNMFDVIGLQLLEWKNQDMTQMVIYSGETPVGSFSYRTVVTTNKLYNALMKKGMIPSSVSYEDPLKFIA